jgi:cysteine-rich repeat protein
VTVLQGATLRIEAGVEVVVEKPAVPKTVAFGDVSDVIVKGKLQIAGTAAEPVRIHGMEATKGFWRGIVAMPEATEVTVEHAILADAWRGIESRALGSTLTVRESGFNHCANAGLMLLKGTPVLQGVDVSGNSQNGIWAEHLGHVSWDRITSVGSRITLWELDADLDNVLVTDSSEGLGLFPKDGTIRVRNATLRGNGVAVNAGAYEGSSVELVNSVIAGSTKAGVKRWSPDHTGQVKVLGSVVFDNHGVDFGDDQMIVTGTFVADPRFVSATDARLLPDSPCVDAAGANATAHDLLGLARPLGARADIGAYEFVPGACGNAAVEGSEQCDDGNLLDGDGCDASCAIEVVVPPEMDAGVPDAEPAPIDADVPDAGTPDAAFDAAPVEGDGGFADAGPIDAGPADAAPQTHADAQPIIPEPPVTEPEPEGCDCRVGGVGRGTSPGAASLAGVALAALLLCRRRRG